MSVILGSWIIGWDLILEYLVGAAAVSVGWSGYVVSFLEDTFNITASSVWTEAPFVFDVKTESFSLTGSYINLPAVAVVLAITFLLTMGVKESAMVNSVAVVIKVAVVLSKWQRTSCLSDDTLSMTSVSLRLNSLQYSSLPGSVM